MVQRDQWPDPLSGWVSIHLLSATDFPEFWRAGLFAIPDFADLSNSTIGDGGRSQLRLPELIRSFRLPCP